MRRFVLGFMLGVVVSAAVAAATWPPAPDTAPELDPPPHTGGDPALEAPPRPTDDAPDDAMSRSARRHTPAPPESAASDPETATEEPPIVALRETLRSRQWVRLRDGVRRVRREHPLMVIPRELVVEIWEQGVVEAEDAFAHEAARTALRSWREHSLVEEVTGITHGDPAYAVLAALIDELTASLAERPHAVHDLMRLLLGSRDARLRRAGLHLAATGAAPQIDVLATAASSEPDEETRAAALVHLINRSVYDDPASRAAAGAAANELFDDASSPRRLRTIAMPALRYGGTRGLDAAQRLVIAGGLNDRDRRTLLDGLVEAGRMPALLESAAGNRELRLHLCESVFASDEARLADVVALWPYIPSVIDTPGEEWTEWVPYTLIELGREDLVEELIRNERLSDSARTGALDALADEDGDPRRALQLGRHLLDGPDSSAALRREVVDTVERVAYEDHGLIAEVLALLGHVVASDANEWVRADAGYAAERIAKNAGSQR